MDTAPHTPRQAPAPAPADSPEPTVPAAKVADDDANDRAPHPRRHFTSPDLLVADASLTDAEKLALLQEWDLDLDNRLKAEAEGMSASDPISERKEAKLAEESARVKRTITELAGRIGQDG